jgi:hypothetical protein
MNPTLLRPDVVLSFALTRDSNGVREITFRNNGLYPVVDSAGVLTFKQLKPPVDKGYTEARYIVDEFQAIDSRNYPKRYRILYYTAKSALEDPGSLDLTRVQVAVRRIALEHLPLDQMARVEGLASVYDERAKESDGSPARYFTKDFIHGTNTAAFQRAWDREQRKTRKPSGEAYP